MTFHVDGVPHYETPNPYGYDEVALAEKTRALKELAQLYPDGRRLHSSTGWTVSAAHTARVLHVHQLLHGEYQQLSLSTY